MSRAVRIIIDAIVAAIVLVCMVSFIIDGVVLSQTYARTPERSPSLLATYEDYADSYPRTNESFTLDGYTLRGHVYGAENTRGLIIFRHGIFSHHEEYLPLITAMVDKGWKVFAYDAIGCGESDGDSVLGMSQSPIDVEAAVRYAQESGMADDMKIALWGHSWGGYGVAAALARVDGVDACVTMSGFDSPMKILTNTAEQNFGILGSMQRPFLWLHTYLEFHDDADLSAADAIINSGVPTLIIHGTGDVTVPYDGVSIQSAIVERTQDVDNAPVSIIIKDTPGRDGHNDYFYSPASQAYLNENYEQLNEMLDEKGDDATSPEVVALLENFDTLRANTADPDLINEIDSFLSAELGT